MTRLETLYCDAYKLRNEIKKGFDRLERTFRNAAFAHVANQRNLFARVFNVLSFDKSS